MAFDDRSLDDYNTVAERLEKWRADYPDGRLRPVNPDLPYQVERVPNGWCVKCGGAQIIKKSGSWVKCPRCDGTGIRSEREPQEDVFIVYAAAARRDRNDSEPGIGLAWERYPGRTPYTAGSELMNAETSSWGRALVAANAADARKGVASAEEIRNREADEEHAPGGGRWMNRRPDVPPRELQDKRTPAPVTGAEHEQLRDGTVEAAPGDRPAKRTRGQAPEGDPWLGQPPGIYGERPPEERPGSMSDKQRGRLFKAFADLDISRPTAQRDVLSDILKRPISSRKDLSYVDAEKVLADLEARVEAKEAAEQAQAAADAQAGAEVDAP